MKVVWIMDYLFVLAVIFIFVYILWYGIDIRLGERIHLGLYGLSRYFR